jgi:hypothetical protein
MTNLSNIAAALAKAQNEMDPVRKDAKNDAFKRNGQATAYATLQSVIDACLPAFNANGIAVVQPIGQDELGMFVGTRLVHISGEQMECRVPLIIGKNDMQGFGSAVTYARRYGLMAMAGIAPEDDDGNAAVVAAPPPRQAPPKAEPLEDIVTFTAKIDATVFAISKQQSVETMTAYWHTLEKAVQADAKVIAAAKKRKAELMTDDAIPYEGAA